MNELLLAESTYQQMEVESALLPDVHYITINGAGELKRDGKKIQESDLSLDMARLDLALFMTGQVELITRLMEQTDAFRFVQTSAAGLDNPLFQAYRGQDRGVL